MIKTFTLRVDLESDKGIKEGLPKLLDLLKRYDLKASFYLVMGGESNIFDIFKYKGKMKSSAERKIKVWSLRDKIRVVLLPKDFVKENKKILGRILDEGHELGIHGWKHRAWTRGLDKINIKEHLVKAKRKYIKYFGKTLVSFSSPGFNTNKGVLKFLELGKIKYISDFPGEKIKNYGKIKNIPMTILGENKTPIIEYLISKDKNDGEILEYMKKQIKEKKLVSFYIHGLFEARFKLNLLEEIFKFIKNKKLKNKRIMDY